MQQRQRLTWGVLAAAAVLAAGCAHMFHQPEVRLESIQVGGIGLRGATLVAQLHVTNPNSFDLKTRSMTYDLELQDPEKAESYMRLAQGVIDQKIEVDANSVKIVEIPIEFRYSDLGPALRSLIDRGTFGYRVSGHIDVQEPLSRSVPFRKTGRVSLEGAK